MRRLSREIAWCGFVGVVASVIVAIGLAVRWLPDGVAGRQVAADYKRGRVGHLFTGEEYRGFVFGEYWVYDTRYPMRDRYGRWPPYEESAPLFLLPPPRASMSHGSSLIKTHRDVGVAAAGFPMLCLRGQVTRRFVDLGSDVRPQHLRQFEVPPQYRFAMLLIRDNHFGFGGPECMVPLGPLPIGLTVNTVCYGALFWAVRFGPGRVRGAIRRRVGRCPSCGYNLAGSPNLCPECGRASVHAVS